jgi:hypothetical protein
MSLSAEGGQLRVKAPPGVLTAKLRDELTAQKDEILKLLGEVAPNRHSTDRERRTFAALLCSGTTLVYRADGAGEFHLQYARVLSSQRPA